MEEKTEAIFDVRAEQMVPHIGDTNPVLRLAHFLKPTVDSKKWPVLKAPSISPSSLPPTFEPAEWPVKVNFSGWRKPKPNWKSWVQNLEPKYQSLWKMAGIYEAIMGSTCSIIRDYDFIIGMAEKWCPETNNFVFPWGEATLTLEDMIILGGYSVLGSPVFSCAVCESIELKEINEKLIEAGKELGKGQDGKPWQTKWMEKFMSSESEIEQEAFLSLWLARYVFRDSERVLKFHFFPMAIHLARGERLALAPAVLSSIYRDLSLLKATIVATTKFDTFEGDKDVLPVTLWSPFLLVQLWGWERIPAFQPNPKPTKIGDPRIARWDGVKGVKVKNVRLALDFAGENFQWRPYANGWHFPEFYREKGEWVELGSNEDLLSFVLCLRVSNLVGLGSIEQYLPHRVAMQFGMDQDIPDHVARTNQNCKLAWNNYIRPLSNTKILYIPSRFFKADVSIKYADWWREPMQDMIKDAIKDVVRRKRSFRKRSNRVPWVLMNEAQNDLHVPPGFPSKTNRKKEMEAIDVAKPLYGERRPSSSVDSIEERGDEVAGDIELPVEPEGKTMQVNAEMGGLQLASDEAVVCKSWTYIHNMASTNRNTEESNTAMFQIPGLELEARIARLEREFAKIKAERCGAKVVNNPTEKCCTHAGLRATHYLDSVHFV